MTKLEDLVGSAIKSVIASQFHLRNESIKYIQDNMDDKKFKTIDVITEKSELKIPVIAITGIPHMEIEETTIEFSVRPTVDSEDKIVGDFTNSDSSQEYIKYSIKLTKSDMEKGLEDILDEATSQITRQSE